MVTSYSPDYLFDLHCEDYYNETRNQWTADDLVEDEEYEWEDDARFPDETEFYSRFYL